MLKPGTANIPDQALEHARRGEIVEAIKVVREQTGLGLKEAKDAIDGYLRNPGQSSGVAGSAGKPDNLEVSSLALYALENGRLIDAIKHVRADTGLGLKDAKEHVERLLDRDAALNARFKAAAAVESRRVARKLVFVIVLSGLVAVGYFYLSGGIR